MPFSLPFSNLIYSKRNVGTKSTSFSAFYERFVQICEFFFCKKVEWENDKMVTVLIIDLERYEVKS